MSVRWWFHYGDQSGLNFAHVNVRWRIDTSVFENAAAAIVGEKMVAAGLPDSREEMYLLADKFARKLTITGVEKRLKRDFHMYGISAYDDLDGPAEEVAIEVVSQYCRGLLAGRNAYQTPEEIEQQRVRIESQRARREELRNER